MVLFPRVKSDSFWPFLASFEASTLGELVLDITPEASCLCARGKGRGL